MLRAKLCFLISVSVELEPFLGKYQTDWPMLPFMRNDLFILIKGLMAPILISPVMAKIKDVTDLTKIDLDDKSNLCLPKSVDIGFAAAQVLDSAKNLKGIGITQFQSQCQQFILTICKKLIAKSPVSCSLLRGASCFSPDVMQSETIAKTRVEVALSYLVRKKRLNAIDADRIKKEYCTLISSKAVTKKLKEFDYKEDRLNSFLLDILAAEKASTQFQNFLKLILILYHGNA